MLIEPNTGLSNGELIQTYRNTFTFTLESHLPNMTSQPVETTD